MRIVAGRNRSDFFIFFHIIDLKALLDVVKSTKVLTFDREDTSESDSRISAQVIGYAAILFLAIEGGIFLLMDTHLIYRQFKSRFWPALKRTCNNIRISGSIRVVEFRSPAPGDNSSMEDWFYLSLEPLECP